MVFFVYSQFHFLNNFVNFHALNTNLNNQYHEYVKGI